MYSMVHTSSRVVVGGLLALALAPAAWSQQVIQNGSFEADAAVIQSPDPFTAWTAAENGILGGVAINKGTIAPASGAATVGASDGKNYAVLDLAQPSQMALWQTFSIGAQPVASATLSFKWFANYSGAETAFIHGPQGLDYNSSDDVLTFRVDILKAGASAFSTAASDLAFSALLNAPLSGGPNPYLGFSQNVSGLVAGETYSLRFAAAANRGQLAVGIDNVALTVSPVPEPSAWALMAAGLSFVAFAIRRRA